MVCKTTLSYITTQVIVIKLYKNLSIESQVLSQNISAPGEILFESWGISMQTGTDRDGYETCEL